MKKIISLFQRNYDGDHLVRNEVVPGAEWVLVGEGVATRKFDGTCCLFKDGVWFKRYDAKHGKTPPPGFVPAQEHDPKTGHWPGWIQLTPNDYWHLEAIARGRWFTFDRGEFLPMVEFSDGTYELLGPKVQANPEKAPEHLLVRHGSLCDTYLDRPENRTFEKIRDYFEKQSFEGVVWHHPDGRMVKIKRRDFWR